MGQLLTVRNIEEAAAILKDEEIYRCAKQAKQHEQDSSEWQALLDQALARKQKILRELRRKNATD